MNRWLLGRPLRDRARVRPRRMRRRWRGGGGAARSRSTPPTPTPTPNPTPTPPTPNSNSDANADATPTPTPTPRQRPARTSTQRSIKRRTMPSRRTRSRPTTPARPARGSKSESSTRGINPALFEFAGRIDPASGDVTGAGRGVSDEGGHGTAVSSVAAGGRNGVNTMGVAFNATIVSMRADDPGSCASRRMLVLRHRHCDRN